MTDQEIIERGLNAEAVLASVPFTDAMNTISSFHLEAMLACEPISQEQKDTRDYHFSMIKALQEVTGTLVGWVQAQRELEKTMVENEDEI